MKKNTIIVLVLTIIIICLILIIFSGYIYFNRVILGHNNVISYGPEMTISSILKSTGNYDEQTNKILTTKVKKAITKSFGSTVRTTYDIGNNKIIFIGGNRNLVLINGKTYIEVLDNN